MAIENSVSKDFLSTFHDNIGVVNCHLPGVPRLTVNLKIFMSVLFSSAKHFVKIKPSQNGKITQTCCLLM